MLLGALFMAFIILIACTCFYMGYIQGSKRSNSKIALTKEQEGIKYKREQLENQFDKMFNFSIHKAKEKR